MDRLFLLQKSYCEDKYDVDGMIIKHLLSNYCIRNCDEYKVVEENDIDRNIQIAEQRRRKIIPIGNILFIKEVLKKVGNNKNTEMVPIEIPAPMLFFAEREYFTIKGIDLKNTKYTSGDYFIKNISELKKWNSLLYDNDITRFIEDDVTYSVSEKVEFVSEYRIFVLNDNIVSIQNYLGDITVFPNINTIKKMVNAYKSEDRPSAYTLDVGIIEKEGFTKTVPIEVHPFVACGLYGFYDEIILDMLEKGFDWYLHGDKKKEVLSFILNHYKAGEYIYPSVVKKYLKLTEDQLNRYMKKLQKDGVIKKIYSTRCYNCNRIMEFYEKLQDIPDETECPHCQVINITDKVYSKNILYVKT